jgi:hypothetical protein
VHCSTRSHSGGPARRILGDAGSAFMTVIATTSILFVLATTLMMMVGYQTQTTAMRTTRLRATHVADAGINAYLYELKAQYGYYLTAPDTGVISIGDGEAYRVTAQPAANGKPLTLYSTGSAGDGTVTIAATVRFPSFADYMFLSNADLNIGSAATINGQVRCNSNIINAGHITGKVTAAGTVSNSGHIDQGYTEHQAPVDFNQVLADMDTVMLSAKGNNSYFAASGAYGYRVTVNGQSITVDKITGGTTTGNLTTVPVRTLTVPSSGALYFSDSVWVSGAYSVPLTIVSDYNIYVPNNYAPSTMNSTVTGGLIARGDIIVPCWYSSVPQNMTLTAAMLSQSGRVTADMKLGVFRDSIVITGSETYYDGNGGFVTVDGNGNALGGFRSRTYTYDQRLDDYPPPKYPVIQDGSLKVATWIEDKTGYQP